MGGVESIVLGLVQHVNGDGGVGIVGVGGLGWFGWMDAAKTSPLLHGQQTGTPLDAITNRLFFIWPLSENHVEWLNTTIYTDDLFWINYWSLTHMLYGFLWGLFFYNYGFWVALFSFLVTHTIFEVWELWIDKGARSHGHLKDGFVVCRHSCL